MIERIRRPSPGALLLVAMSGVILALVAVVISITALQTKVDTRGQQATKDALCAVWAYQIPRPGEPGPTTDRGRLMVDRALEQYRALGCKPTR